MLKYLILITLLFFQCKLENSNKLMEDKQNEIILYIYSLMKDCYYVNSSNNEVYAIELILKLDEKVPMGDLYYLKFAFFDNTGIQINNFIGCDMITTAVFETCSDSFKHLSSISNIFFYENDLINECMTFKKAVGENNLAVQNYYLKDLVNNKKLCNN